MEIEEISLPTSHTYVDDGYHPELRVRMTPLVNSWIQVNQELFFFVIELICHRIAKYILYTIYNQVSLSLVK